MKDYIHTDKNKQNDYIIVKNDVSQLMNSAFGYTGLENKHSNQHLVNNSMAFVKLQRL